jgi:WD40 repeat protein
LSNDGKYIAFLSNGNQKRGELFIDLWLGNGRTGERMKRLVKSTLDPDFEELRLLYSQSAFSNDEKTLAFTAMREGKDVLYLLDVPSRKVRKRLDLPLDGVTGPSYSPDDSHIVFSGTHGGVTDLYIVDADGKNLRQLTNDLYGDLQPSWSPDGKRIAFATDRASPTDITRLRFAKWQIALIDPETGVVETIPNQAGLNLNPAWAPDGQSIAYISDRTGVPNVFLYDLNDKLQYQLTSVIGGVSAITEYSPALTWARKADRLAFTYYENGDYTVWSMDNPRSLKRTAFTGQGAASTALLMNVPTLPSIVQASSGAVDTAKAAGTAEKASIYRAPGGTRLSARLSTTELQEDAFEATTVAVLNANPDFALPDTARFRDYKYNVGFKPDYIAQPEVGYGTGNQYGLSGFNGGTTIVLSDLLGNHQIALSASVYGQLRDASVFAAYANLSHRWQYTAGAYQQPIFLPQSGGDPPLENPDGSVRFSVLYTRFVLRNSFFTAQYPLNRFTRFEAGAQFNSIGRSIISLSQDCYLNGCMAPEIHDVANAPAFNFFSPSLAFVSDNTLFGYTAPVIGRRYRFQVTPSVGNLRWTELLADYRRYDPIIFNTITIATRFLGSASVGRDEDAFPKYIGRPEYVRGYDKANFYGYECTGYIGGGSNCATEQLVGSRVLVANAELRFPLVRRFDLGTLPVGLPPIEGLIFYDAGVAWSKGQEVSLKKPENYDFTLQRYPLRSYGAGIRVNLFNLAILKWDYAIPLDKPGRKANWTFSLGPSF